MRQWERSWYTALNPKVCIAKVFHDNNFLTLNERRSAKRLGINCTVRFRRTTCVNILRFRRSDSDFLASSEDSLRVLWVLTSFSDETSLTSPIGFFMKLLSVARYDNGARVGVRLFSHPNEQKTYVLG